MVGTQPSGHSCSESSLPQILPPKARGQGGREKKSGEGTQPPLLPPSCLLTQLFLCSLLCAKPHGCGMVNVVERPLDKAITSIKIWAQLHTTESSRDCGVNKGAVYFSLI